MRFTTFIHDGVPRVGVVDGDTVVDIGRTAPGARFDLSEAFATEANLRSLAQQALEDPNAVRLPEKDLSFAPLLPNPGKIVCLGLNYYDHAKEGGRDKPDYPWFFLRCSTSLLGHGQPVVLPRVSEKLDWEAELAVVIGARVPRHVPESEALEYVYGYACFNDVSVRDYQKKTGQWTIGKIFDGTGPFGPTLVTGDEIPAGASGLRIQCRVNGAVMQDSRTDDMIWGVAEAISLLSEAITLEPGDVIAMGTPSGVGQSRNPPIWLRSGDVVEIEIEKLGVLRNEVRHESAEQG